MDPSRKSRRRVDCLRDAGAVPSAAPSRRRIIRAKFHLHGSLGIILKDADMTVVIGPVLKRADGYEFDTWTAGKEVARGYPYRRIEDAYYARNADIKASAQGRARGGPIFCVSSSRDALYVLGGSRTWHERS